MTDFDGTQWLRTPDGWILEKLSVVVCGTCASQRNADGESPVCTHSYLFLRPLLAKNSASAETPSVGLTSSTVQASSGSASTVSAVATFSCPIVPTDHAESVQSSSASAPRVYSRHAMKDRLLPNETNHDSTYSNAKAPFSAVLSDDKDVFVRTTDGSASRFEQMLVLQNQIENLTKTLIEANRSLLVCQQSLSQLIKGEFEEHNVV